MDANQTVFQRIEKKYLLREPQAALLQRKLESYLAPDVYGESQICSVYFDAPFSGEASL